MPPYSRNVKEYYDRRAPEYDDWYRGIHYEAEERERFLAGGQRPARATSEATRWSFPSATARSNRVFTGHFYGHLEEPERVRFLAEARRVAPELVVADAPLRPNHAPAEWQQRGVSDGSVWPVYKRFFSPDALLAELGGGEILLDGEWFVVVVSP